MIRRLEVKGLRALRYVWVDFDPFMVMVGPNASGKSTLFDSLLLVRDILNSGLDAAVFGNTRMGIPPRAVTPIDLTWLRKGETVEIAITLELPSMVIDKLDKRFQYARYEIAISCNDELRFDHEALWLCSDLKTPKARLQRGLFPLPETPPKHLIIPSNSKTPQGWQKIVGKVVESGNDYFRSETSKWNNMFRLGAAKSALANLPEDENKFPAATWVKRLLMEGAHGLMLNAEKMRMPAPAGSPSDFLPDGSNLPWVVHKLEESPQKKSDWISHLATTLTDLRDIRTVERPEDRSRYIELHYGSGLSAPSWVLSDGTLRLLALTLLAYAPTTPKILLIEEPENGIHPKAMETVIQSLSSVYESQVLCATHSPVVLSLIQRDQVLCFAKTSEGAIDIVKGTDHPRLKEWQSASNLGELFAMGVLG